MNNINSLDRVNVYQNKSRSFSKLPYIFAISTMLSIANPKEIKAENIVYRNLQNIELAQDSSIINNIQMRTGVELPEQYSQKIQNFLLNNKVMKDSGNSKFTENFIVNQMKSERGISKQNQLLFIRSEIYNKVMKKTLYDGDIGDGNKKRLEEFDLALEYIVDCGEEYKSGLLSYMNQRSTEYDRQSAEARQQSIEARQQSAEARQQSAEALNSSLKNLARFYNRYKKDPSTIKDEEVKQRKEKGKEVIQRCKEIRIDYKTKLSKDMLKFYGVE